MLTARILNELNYLNCAIASVETKYGPINERITVYSEYTCLLRACIVNNCLSHDIDNIQLISYFRRVHLL